MNLMTQSSVLLFTCFSVWMALVWLVCGNSCFYIYYYYYELSVQYTYFVISKMITLKKVLSSWRRFGSLN